MTIFRLTYDLFKYEMKPSKFWNGNVKNFKNKEELEGGIQAHPHGGTLRLAD
jgi:hypothetical protein